MCNAPRVAINALLMHYLIRSSKSLFENIFLACFVSSFCLITYTAEKTWIAPKNLYFFSYRLHNCFTYLISVAIKTAKKVKFWYMVISYLHWSLPTEIRYTASNYICLFHTSLVFSREKLALRRCCNFHTPIQNRFTVSIVFSVRFYCMSILCERLVWTAKWSASTIYNIYGASLISFILFLRPLLYTIETFKYMYGCIQQEILVTKVYSTLSKTVVLSRCVATQKTVLLKIVSTKASFGQRFLTKHKHQTHPIDGNPVLRKPRSNLYSR